MRKKTFLIVLALTAAPASAKGRKPEEPSIKQDANKVLEDFDRGVHKALPAAKKGAEKAMDSVDKGVHKLIKDAQTT